MEKKLEDYIHFYFGCDVQTTARKEASLGQKMGYKTGKMIDMDIRCKQSAIEVDGVPIDFDWTEIKPILRPITDITKDELRLIAKLTAPTEDISGKYLDDAFTQMQNLFIKHGINAFSFDELSSMQIFEVTALFLKQGFDLFGLIEAGLAIDKTKI